MIDYKSIACLNSGLSSQSVDETASVARDLGVGPEILVLGLYFAPFIIVALILVIKWIPHQRIQNQLKRAVKKPLQADSIRWLEDNVPFYSNLSVKEKIRFRKRVSWFIVYKNFILKNGLVLTELTKVKIAASAIQLTFGYNKVKLHHFNDIIVYPDKFKSPFTKKMTFGEVNPVGAIVLSMKELEKGYAIKDDGINLGLHELSHVLLLEHKNKRANYAFIKEKDLNKLYDFSLEVNKKEKRVGGLYNKYAFSNFHEFFAKTIELFFEKGSELKELYPDVYHVTGKILNLE